MAGHFGNASLSHIDLVRVNLFLGRRLVLKNWSWVKIPRGLCAAKVSEFMSFHYEQAHVTSMTG